MEIVTRFEVQGATAGEVLREVRRQANSARDFLVEEVKRHEGEEPQNLTCAISDWFQKELIARSWLYQVCNDEALDELRVLLLEHLDAGRRLMDQNGQPDADLPATLKQRLMVVG